MAKRTVRVKGAAIIGDNAGCFLPAMLQRMQAQSCQNAGFIAAKNPKNPAFLVKAVCITHIERIGRAQQIHAFHFQ